MIMKVSDDSNWLQEVYYNGKRYPLRFQDTWGLLPPTKVGAEAAQAMVGTISPTEQPLLPQSQIGPFQSPHRGQSARSLQV